MFIHAEGGDNRRGIMSRTGCIMGDVDEGRCVQVSAIHGRGTDAMRVLSTERLHGGDVYDPCARNRIGCLGAYVLMAPSQRAVDEAVERARERLRTGERLDGLVVRKVPWFDEPEDVLIEPADEEPAT